MKLDIFLQKTSNVMAENRLLKFVVVVIGVATIINSVMIQYAFNAQRVILIPPGLDSKVETRGYELSDNYIKTMTQYVQSLAFTYTPANARKQFDSLLALYAADSYPSAQRTFYDLASKIEMANITGSFYMDPKIVLDQTNKTIEISGISRKYKDTILVSDSNNTHYVIAYRVIDGKFQLVSVKEKEKV